jgi:hypothetical protein
MDRKATGVAALLIGIAGVGCGGGHDYSPSTVNHDGGSKDAPVDTARAAPMASASSRRLISGLAVLVGNGPDSCTHQVPATTDRWCGFIAPSRFLGQATYDLWVINVTRAAAGVDIVCNGSHLSDCVPLTSNPVIDPNSGPGVHTFTGDTFIYYENAAASADGGTATPPVFAWRPGWTAGRKITPPGGLFCSGHPKTDAVMCLSNRQETAAGDISADLLAGPMPAEGSVLPTVATLLAIASTDDPSGPVHYGLALSPAGDYVAWSARPTVAGVETLNSQKLGDPTTKKVVATDVSQWLISPDSARFYWLKTFNYSASAPAGTLQQAAFPDGSGATMLATGVGDFNRAGNRGVIYRSGVTAGLGTLQAIADRDAPATVLTLDHNVAGVVGASADGARVAYAKLVDATTFSNTVLVDLYGAGIDKPTPCAMLTTPTALPQVTMTATGTSAVWVNVNAQTSNAVGVQTDLGACTSRNFAPNLLTAAAVGDEGYVYGDQTTDGSDMTLQYASLTGGALPAGTMIQTRAYPVFAVLPPALPAVVYSVYVQGDQDGLYINASLPFTAAAIPDAGSN